MDSQKSFWKRSCFGILHISLEMVIMIKADMLETYTLQSEQSCLDPRFFISHFTHCDVFELRIWVASLTCTSELRVWVAMQVVSNAELHQVPHTAMHLSCVSELQCNLCETQSYIKCHTLRCIWVACLSCNASCVELRATSSATRCDAFELRIRVAMLVVLSSELHQVPHTAMHLNCVSELQCKLCQTQSYIKIRLHF